MAPLDQKAKLETGELKVQQALRVNMETLEVLDPLACKV